MTPSLRRLFLLSTLVLLFMLAACGQEEATQTAVLPTTVAATNTAEPTATATNTPEPTATATNTPEPTATATNTPEPTATLAPTAVPATATAVPASDSNASNDNNAGNDGSGEGEEGGDAEATPEFITLYYISNPSDILGTFPVQPFDADAIRSDMVGMQQSLYTMRNNLDGAKAGDAAACAAYVQAYNNILYGSRFFNDVPPGWQDIETIYVLSFVYSLDRTRPAYLSCADSGRIDEFNYGLAYTSIEQTLNFLNPGIDSAAGR